MEVCSWPPWPTGLAESQPKYVTLGDQCILTLPCGVLYNEISLCSLQGMGGQKTTSLSLFSLNASYVEGRSCWYTFEYGCVAALGQQTLPKQAWTVFTVSWP